MTLAKERQQPASRPKHPECDRTPADPTSTLKRPLVPPPLPGTEMPRLVDELHDDHQLHAADDLVTYRCAEGHTLTLAAGDNPRRGGCSRPRVVKGSGGGGRGDGGGGGSAGVGVDGGIKGGVNGAGWAQSGAVAVGARSARAARELWSVWPEVVASGMNQFREEVRFLR